MLAALLGALFLLNAVPAQAQTTVWEATLTVRDMSNSINNGCNTSQSAAIQKCSNTATLTEDEFTFNDLSYRFSNIHQRASRFIINFIVSGTPDAAFRALEVCVGTQHSYPLSGLYASGNLWSETFTSGVPFVWAIGEVVELSIKSDCSWVPGLVTVRLSLPDGNSVDEGESITVAAHLSEVPSSDVTIPITLTSSTVSSIAAEPGVDYDDSLTSITINAGNTTGTIRIMAHDDNEDESNEILYVQINDLPPSIGSLGTPDIVAFTIIDNDESTTTTTTDPPTTTPTDPSPRTNQPTDQTPSNTGGTGIGGGGEGGGGLPPPGSDEEPSTSCPQEDREILGSFYEMTDGEGWDENENWNSEEPLDQWYGVETDDAGDVVSLRLADNNLSGNMPTEELLCLNENTELKELSLWDNEDLLGEVPEELVLAVERAALRYIAERLDLNPEWFYDYEDPFDFEDWYEGVTTDDDGRVVELDLPGEIPESIISQFKKRREIMITTSDGGCALSPEGSSAFSLFFLTLFVFAVLVRKKGRG